MPPTLQGGPARAREAAVPRLAALYARVSTEEQARHGFSLGEQLARCRARALELGAEGVAEFVDDGVSGELWERPALSALRAQVRAGGVSIFVCLDPDRLARRLVHQLLATEELERCGVRIEFVDFEWRATAEGQLFAQLRGAIAEYEKAKIRARTALGRHGKALRGGLPHYTCPYGYRWRDGGLAVAPAEAAGVVAAFRWFVSDPDLGYRALARLMHDAYPPRRGRWDGSAIRRLLARSAYVGRMRVEQYDAEGAHLNRHLPRAQRVAYRRARPAGAGVDVPVPAIVDPALWEAAQAKAARLRGRRGAARPAAYLLSGLVRCGRCGRTMAGKTQRARGRTYRYYACRAGCGVRQVRAGELEEAVWGAVADAVVDGDALAAALGGEQGGGQGGTAPADDPLAQALAGLEQEQERVWAAWRRGLVDATRFEAAVGEGAGGGPRGAAGGTGTEPGVGSGTGSGPDVGRPRPARGRRVATSLEVAVVQNRGRDFLARAHQLGFRHIEISDGTIQMSARTRGRLIELAQQMGMQVLTEVGKKHPADRVPRSNIREQIAADLGSGAWKVIVEGRESGKGVVIYREDGSIDEDELEGLATAADPHRLIWEAPLKVQQQDLILRFGPNVNLGNVEPQDALSVESLRVGLRGDTLRAAILGSAIPAANGLGDEGKAP